MTETIGVAGCGRMGLGMLRNLQRAGFAAKGFDVRDIAGVGTDISAFGQGLETVFIVVRDAAQIDDLLFDEQNLPLHTQSTQQPYPQALRHIVICSTVSPRFVKDLRKCFPASISVIDAPMSGAKIKADAGTLTFMTGGDIAPIRPYLDAMGSEIHDMGAPGAGMTAKVLNNLLAASHTAMTRLVLDWADAEGVDEAKLLNMIAASSGQNWLASGFDDIEFARDGYSDNNSIGILVKDVASALDIGPDDQKTLPLAVQKAIRALQPRGKK